MNQLSRLDEELLRNIANWEQCRKDRAPLKQQKVGRFTIACLILNRTIGSGIFITPREVLLGTRSVGVSIILWAVGGLVMTAGTVVWNEFGLTIPQRDVPGGHRKAVPRSGGEKNYLEFLLPRPAFLATCLFGIPWLILGNLAGNAVAFGTYSLQAAGFEDAPRSWNIGIAIAISTASCAIHLFSRRGGIALSNFLAIIKVLMLVLILVLGFAVGNEDKIDQGKSYVSNLATSKSFAGHSTHFSDFTYSFLYILYTYSGFDQPFYILSEVKRPRKIFPRTTLLTMVFIATLYVLVNVAYVCAVPIDAATLESRTDMATLFFKSIFGGGVATRIMSAMISVSVAGNIIVMTFTASRVKQEIAKEGILPWSLFFSTGHTSPYALLREKLSTQRNKPKPSRQPTASPDGMHWSKEKREAMRQATDELHHPERTPIPALFLHWLLSITMIAVTAHLTALTAYNVLVFLFSYVMVTMVGFLVSSGLVIQYFSPSSRWQKADGPSGFRPWGGPCAAMLFAAVTMLIIVTAFLPPAPTSPYSYQATQIEWYILPSIGLSALIWGVPWWLGLRGIMRWRGLKLVVTRIPDIHWDGDEGDDDGAWVQRSEIIVREKVSRLSEWQDGAAGVLQLQALAQRNPSPVASGLWDLGAASARLPSAPDAGVVGWRRGTGHESSGYIESQRV